MRIGEHRSSYRGQKTSSDLELKLQAVVSSMGVLEHSGPGRMAAALTIEPPLQPCYGLTLPLCVFFLKSIINYRVRSIITIKHV